jgi:hypothetical protein
MMFPGALTNAPESGADARTPCLPGSFKADVGFSGTPGTAGIFRLIRRRR